MAKIETLFELDAGVQARLSLTPRPGVWAPSVFGWRIARFLSNIELAGKRTLDIGAGSGLLGIVAALRGASVCASDVEPESVEAVRANAAASGVTVDVRLGPGLAPWAGELFDLVICNAPGVERTPGGGLRFRPIPSLTQSVLDAQRACLKPGGRIIGLACGPFAAESARTAILRADLEAEVIWAAHDRATAAELGTYDEQMLLESGLADRFEDKLSLVTAVFCAVKP